MTFSFVVISDDFIRFSHISIVCGRLCGSVASDDFLQFIVLRFCSEASRAPARGVLEKASEY